LYKPRNLPALFAILWEKFCLKEEDDKKKKKEEEEEGRSLFVDTVILVFPTRDSFVCIL
jgi:hypothetical protein